MTTPWIIGAFFALQALPCGIGPYHPLLLRPPSQQATRCTWRTGERANGRTRGQESVLQAPIWSRNHWVLPKGTQNKSVLQISHWTKSGTFGVLTTRLLEAKLALQISCSLCMCRTAWSRDTSCQRCCGHPVGDFLRQKPAHPIWKISYKNIPIQKESKGIQRDPIKNIQKLNQTPDLGPFNSPGRSLQGSDGSRLQDVLIDAHERHGVATWHVLDLLGGAAHHQHGALDVLHVQVLLASWELGHWIMQLH